MECTNWPEWPSYLIDLAFPFTYYCKCTIVSGALICLSCPTLNLFQYIDFFCGIIGIQNILLEHIAWQIHCVQLIKDLCVAMLLTQPQICWERGLKGTVSFLGLLRGQNLSSGVPNNDKDTLTVELTMSVPAWTGPYPKWVKTMAMCLKLASTVLQSRCELMTTLKRYVGKNSIPVTWFVGVVCRHSPPFVFLKLVEAETETVEWYV